MEEMNTQVSMPKEDTPQAQDTQNPASEGNTGRKEETEGEKIPFEQLIAQEYRQEYEQAVGKRIQAAIQQRFRSQEDYKARWEAYRPIIDALKTRYGGEKAGPREIAAGMLRQADAERQTREKANGRDAALRAHFASLTRQAEELKRAFPGFDLMEEMAHPTFLRMTAPGSGMSVKDAFYAVHGEEIQRDSMRYAARQAGENVAASIRAGAARPPENGLNRADAVSLKVDIEHMDKKTREAYRQRIRNGETINFRDKI